MKKIGRPIAMLSMLLTVSLILGACGGDNGGGTAGPSATGGIPSPTGGIATLATPTSGKLAQSTPTQAHSTQGATVIVEQQDYKFSPQNVTVNVGDTVTFVNKGATMHTATASDGSFDSGGMNTNATFNQTFTKPGTIKYYCKFHGSADGAGMAGAITVVQGNGGRPPATPSAAGGSGTGAPDTLAADDQPVGNTVVVKHIHANQDGFVVIHANTADNKPGNQLGHTQIKAGDSDNVVVQVSPAPKAGDKVWPMLHIDAGTIGTYEFPGPDAPVIVGGNIVMKQITLTAALTLSVEADDQPTATSIKVKRVVAAQDGWITVHANTADNKPGDQLGHTPIKAGENTNVVIKLSSTPKAGDKVWPMLHIDAGTIGTYEFPGPDAPVIVGGNIVMKQITLTTPPPIPTIVPSVTITVQIQDYQFLPNDITINPGTNVTFVNKGATKHTVTAVDGSWDSGDVAPGASYSLTFSSEGVFLFYCKYHGSASGTGMAGAITVVRNAGNPAPTPP